MHPLPQYLRATADGVEIDGPQGTVDLRLKANRIVAEYSGHELADRSAQAYANEWQHVALLAAETFPLGWTYDSHGKQRIIDHKRFYAQTFRTDLLGIERLRHWQALIGNR